MTNLDDLRKFLHKTDINHSLSKTLLNWSGEVDVIEIEDALAKSGHSRKSSSEYKRTYRKAAEFFLMLEEFGCGKYIRGRHDKPSRFKWTVSPNDFSKFVRGRSKDIPGRFISQGKANPVKEISYPLRSDFDVAFQLPQDISKDELRALAEFISKHVPARS